MKILQVAPPWLSVPPSAYGGIEWVVSGLADGLVDAGHKVTLIASGGSQTKARLVSAFDDPPFGKLGDARIETIQALTAYRDRGDYDIIHDHTAAVGPALAAFADGPPVVHTLHLPWLDEQIRLARLIAPPVRLVAVWRATPTTMAWSRLTILPASRLTSATPCLSRPPWDCWLSV